MIKTNHGRIISLEIMSDTSVVRVKDCYYLDRVQCGNIRAVPQKLTTHNFRFTEILRVIASELDRQYFGVEITDKFTDLTKDEFIAIQLKQTQGNYKFLILTGEGTTFNGIPSILKTRFKNRIHRSIYLEMHYNGKGKGVIADCHYYDRKYKAKSKVIPETLTTVFFNYDRLAILNTVNRELNTAFTHIIFVTDGSLDIDNKVAICGNI